MSFFKKIYVLDTSVYLSDSQAITKYKNSLIIIPYKVLEEIDNFKKHQNSLGTNARRIIRFFDDLRAKGSLSEGVKISPKNKSVVKAMSYRSEHMPLGFDESVPDNQIICTALTVNAECTEEQKVIMVSRDINMRVKCDALGLASEDYVLEQVVSDTTELYSGFTSVLVDDEKVEQFYNNESVFLSETKERVLYPNQFVMLVSSANEKKTALCQFIDHQTSLKKLNEFKKGVWDIKSKNKEQLFALNLLMSKDIPIVSLCGFAGTGKSLLALAAALEQTNLVGDKEKPYKKLIVSRPIQPLGKDIGFLPGDKDSKLIPWLAPIQDNLEFLMGNDRKQLQMYVDDGTIEIEALTYIRGRSIANAFLLVDEAQQLTPHEIKTIATRVGENTKLVFTGDVDQIDNPLVDSTNNGLSYLIEKLKDEKLVGHVTLTHGERSKVSAMTAEKL